MDTAVEEVRTGSTVVTDVTDRLDRFCGGRGDGLVNAFVPHATAGLALLETGAGSEPDLEVALAGLLPRDGRWTHRHGSPGHGADHVLPAFVCPSVSIPVQDGRPLLGTWQRLVVVDTNVDNRVRQLRFSFLAG